jgi:hypothetical protein
MGTETSSERKHSKPQRSESDTRGKVFFDKGEGMTNVDPFLPFFVDSRDIDSDYAKKMSLWGLQFFICYVWINHSIIGKSLYEPLKEKRIHLTGSPAGKNNP